MILLWKSKGKVMSQAMLYPVRNLPKVKIRLKKKKKNLPFFFFLNTAWLQLERNILLNMG